jgi:transposase
MPHKDPAEKAVRDIPRKIRRKFSAEEKIRIVLEGMRGEGSILDASGLHRVAPYFPTVSAFAAANGGKLDAGFREHLRCRGASYIARL